MPAPWVSSVVLADGLPTLQSSMSTGAGDLHLLYMCLKCVQLPQYRLSSSRHAGLHAAAWRLPC